MFQIDDSIRTSEGFTISRLTVTPDELQVGDYLDGCKLTTVDTYTEDDRTTTMVFFEDGGSDFLAPTRECLVERLTTLGPARPKTV